jgi:hypothetical protein
VFDSLRSARLLTSASGLSLATFFAFSGVATAAPMPSFGYTVNGDTLTASVTGDARTGVWRVRLVSPTGAKRVDIVLAKGDVSWAGVVRVSARQGNSWSLVSRRSLADAFMTGTTAAACNAGVCWSTAKFRLPRDGDARFGVTVRLTQSGEYRVSGAVREATEAFVYDSWLSSTSRLVTY